MTDQKLSTLADRVPSTPSGLLAALAARTRAYDFTVWFWGDAIAIDGLAEAADLVGDTESAEHCLRFFRTWSQSELGWVDHLAPGRGLLWCYERSGDEAFLERAVALARWLTGSVPHTVGGQPLYRPDLPPYRHVVWVDTIYHEPSFFARLGQLTGEAYWFDDAIAVWRSHAAVLRRSSDDPILGHSYDTGSGLLRGYGWGRGNGWAVFGLVDLLELMSDDRRRDEVRTEFVELCTEILSLQDASGFWRTLLADPEAYLEASTAAFFGATFTKGVRLGILDDRFASAAERAWSAMLSRIRPDGSLLGVSACTYASVHPDDDLQMYKTLPTEVNVWGQGSALRFAAERLRAGGAV